MAINFYRPSNFVNTPLQKVHRSAAFVLSIINWKYCSCTGIHQIRLEIGRISEKNGRIPDLPERKSGTILYFPSRTSLGELTAALLCLRGASPKSNPGYAYVPGMVRDSLFDFVKEITLANIPLRKYFVPTVSALRGRAPRLPPRFRRLCSIQQQKFDITVQVKPRTHPGPPGFAPHPSPKPLYPGDATAWLQDFLLRPMPWLSQLFITLMRRGIKSQ